MFILFCLDQVHSRPMFTSYSHNRGSAILFLILLAPPVLTLAGLRREGFPQNLFPVFGAKRVEPFQGRERRGNRVKDVPLTTAKRVPDFRDRPATGFRRYVEMIGDDQPEA